MNRGTRYISRRDFLRQAAVVTAGLSAAACAPGATQVPAPAPQTGAETAGAAVATGKKYEGVTLRMLTQAGAAYDPGFNDFATEFEDMTGAKVQIEWSPWESLMPKVQADLASGQPQFDIFANDVEFQYTIYPQLMPINDLIEQFNYNMDGFFPFVYNYGEGIAGQTGVRYGLPMIVGVSVVFYRTDLIPELPTTWEEYEAVLAANTGNGKHGLGFAGVTAQLVKLFLARYWSLGDPLLTPDWKPLINSDKGVQALEMLKEHMEKYAPPGILAWDNPDAAQAFLNGDIAVMEGWPGFILAKIDDPNQSNVVGKWRIGRYPEDGTGNVVQHNMVIFKTSQNPEAAFEFIAYCTGPATQKRSLLDYGMDVAREAVYTDSDVVAAKSFMPDYAEVLKAGKPFTPSVPQWLEMFLAIGEAASLASSGEATPKDALDEAAEKWEQLIAQAPLSFEYGE
jgi:multiple sugar transport system substrate-binding protein